MPQYLLRVEAVNLLATLIDDTDDLSTRRGGGLLALNAVRQIKENVGTPALRKRLTEVATGASVGLFTFDAADQAGAEAVRAEVARYLRAESLEYPGKNGNTEHLHLAVATFAVDVQQLDGASDDDEAVQRAVARNRFRQMRQPSISLAGLWADAKRECQLNCVLPAGALIDRGDERDVAVSASVAERRGYGLNMKRKSYPLIDGDRLRFTNEFSEIADRKSLDPKGQLHPTHEKLAVVYLDGNDFGKHGRTVLREQGIGAYAKWSGGVSDHHDRLRGDLLRHIRGQGGDWLNGGKARLETLLWGGDEILWVVPAWKGWELVHWFFDRGRNHDQVVPGRPLTYSAGLVFCHLKAAIKDIDRLARRLGEVAKTEAKRADPEHPPHRLAYEVMESFDDIFGGLDEHRAKWLPPDRRKAPGQDDWTDPLVVDPARLDTAWHPLRELARPDSELPVRQLHRLCKHWGAGPAADPGKERQRQHEMAAALRRLRADPHGDHFKQVEAALGGEVAWLHLLQMLPYLPTAGAGS